MDIREARNHGRHYPPGTPLGQSLHDRLGEAGVAMSVRIIAGTHRGRVLRTPPGDSLRPTPGLVRERLFSWLGTAVRGARVLDLFAGTGALALEAWSRGAAQICVVEKHPRHRELLRANLEACACPTSALCGHDALTFLSRCSLSFDVIFLDPPFHRGWPRRLQSPLRSSGILERASWLYLESAAEEMWTPADLPPGWSVHREGHCGDSHFRLYRQNPPCAPSL